MTPSSPDAPVTVRDGGVIRAGYSAELDELREDRANGQGYLSALEQREREATGHQKPAHRLQPRVRLLHRSHPTPLADHGAVSIYAASRRWPTASGTSREELKELENKILGAQESALRLEYELFCEIRGAAEGHAAPCYRPRRRRSKTLDALLLACRSVASLHDYARPAINDDGRDSRSSTAAIRWWRHRIGREKFVPERYAARRRRQPRA